MRDWEIRISEASGVPYYRQIVDQIGQLVRSGHLAPGEKLPSVRELAAELLVSLITTRRAYAELENAGLIIRRQGYGSFVAEEIERASHEQALKKVREDLDELIHTARRMGLENAEMRKLFEELIAGEEKDHEQ